MKKVLLWACMFTLLAGLAGCKKEEDVSLDLAKIEKEIVNLKGDEFDRFGAVDIINARVENLSEVYDYDFKKTFGVNITAEDIEDYSVGFNKKTKESYMIIKPLEDKKEDVKAQIEKYYTKNKIANLATSEVDDYLIYLAFEGSEETLKEVEKSHANIYNSLLKLDDDLLKEQLDIAKDDVDEYLIMLPQLITSSSSLVIVKPASGKEDEVKEKLDKYMSDQEEMWKTYLQDQYELIKNREFTEYGDYLIYIVSTDNDAVLKAIKNK